MNSKLFLSLLFLAAPIWAIEYSNLPAEMDYAVAKYLVNPELLVLEDNGCVQAISFSSDSKLIATLTDDKEVKIRNISTGCIIKQFTLDIQVNERVSRSHSISFSPEGFLLASAGVTPNLTVIRNISDDGRIVAQFPGDGTINKTSFYDEKTSLSPDGSLIVYKPDIRRIRINKISDGGTVESLKIKELINPLALSPNGEFLAYSSVFDIYISRIANLDLVARFEPGLWGKYCAFSPDNTLIAYGGTDNKLTICRISDKQIVAQFPVNNMVNCCAFSPDGNLIAAGETKKISICTMAHYKAKTLRHYIFAKTILDRSKKSFYLNEDGHETWQELKDSFKDDFTLYKKINPDKRQKTSDGQGIDSKPLWKLVRKTMQSSSNNNN
jgi:WD40 repeat protein